MKPFVRITPGVAALAVWIMLTLATHTAAAPLRVAAPTPSGKLSVAAQCVAEVLAERLAECGGVDLVRGGRAARAYAAAHDPALDLSDTERWQRFEAMIAVDALIAVEPPDEAIRNKEPATDVQVRIFRARGATVLRAAIGETGGDTAKAVSAFSQRVGKELNLGDADIATLGEIRIDNPAVFRLYYSTRTAYAGWPQNPWASAFFLVNGMHVDKPHWAADATLVRVAGGYTEWAISGRGAEKMPQVSSMVRPPVLRLLGTGHESEAFPLLRLPRRDHAKPILNDIEMVLLQIASPLASQSAPAKHVKGPNAGAAKGGDIDELGADPTKEKAGLPAAVATPTDLSTRTGTDEYTRPQRLGALRMLGALASPESLALLQRAATHPQADVRAITAESLASLSADTGLDTLRTLAGDSDETVALTAAIALSQRGHTPDDFVRRASAKLAGAEPWRTRAALALASDPTVKDRALLDRLSNDPSQAVRRAAARRRADAVGYTLAGTMKEADNALILAAIARVKADTLAIGDEEFNRLATLANDPDDAVTRAAREKLSPLRPKDPVARANFDLAIESPYFRRKAIATLGASGDANARAALVAACANADAQTRIAALQALVTADANAARSVLSKAIADPHRLVRLHAAALLAPIATAAEAATIRAASEREKDRAILLYFADALAKAEGKPLPPPQPAANRVDADTTVVMLSGPMSSLKDSPFRAQFKPSHGNHVRDDEISDTTKRDHDAGVAYFYNITAPSEPGLAIVDRAAQNDYWLYISDQLDTPHLRYIDGIDFGNGNLSPDTLWPEGWRAFCDDTGIDPARVKGDMKALNAYEARAWRGWSLRRCVEGRNFLYDFVKLKLAKLHPGIQVCTGIPVFPGAPMAELKFDVMTCRAESDDRASNRAVFNRIRYAKTTWPDRPVFCIGESLTVKDIAIVKYDFKTPTSPMVGRDYRSYTDALTSWIAGANPGWSCIWVLRKVDWAEPDYSGYVVAPDDTVGEAPSLRAAIDLAFANTEPVIRQKDALAKVSTKSPSLAPGEKEAAMDGLIDETLSADKPDPVAQRIARDKAQMLLGFKIYGKHILDLARLFASLPPNRAKADALVIDEWRDPPRATSAGVELLGYYDCLQDINDAARHELSQYRFIAVDDPQALSDATIETITRWLKETPGVLYVHGDLTSDNARQASTPDTFNGRLRSDWPWEKDVIVSASKSAAEQGKKAPPKITATDGTTIDLREATVARTFELADKSATATAIYTHNGAPVLAVWRHPDFKGAVVFDGVYYGGEAYRTVLRTVLADLKKRDGVGVDPLPAGRHYRFVSDAWTAEVADDSSGARKIAGVDLLTGERSPVVGGERNGALVARDFKGKYAAAGNGVSVLCDRPIRRFEKTDGGVILECDGLIQASSYTGDLVVRRGEGTAMPAIKKEDRVRWMLLENTEGLASDTVGGSDEQASAVYYIRSKRAVTLKTK